MKNGEIVSEDGKAARIQLTFKDNPYDQSSFDTFGVDPNTFR